MPRSGFQCDPAEKEKTLATPRDLAGVMSQFSVKAQGLASRPPLLHGAHASAASALYSVLVPGVRPALSTRRVLKCTCKRINLICGIAI